ncbi:MAG: hypothetical protein K9G33_06945 [Sneathiella sp.]|nr:hypothetical protein [Sneathiella sp.]
MQPCPYSIEDVLYHAPPMILIDRVNAYDEETVISCVEITDESPFVDAGEVPAYVGIEYMAQSIAAYSGIKARNSGAPVKIGYLVSARNMTMACPGFKVGDRLEITVHLVYDETPMAVFDCTIRKDKALVAEARLNVYQP